MNVVLYVNPRSGAGAAAHAAERAARALGDQSHDCVIVPSSKDPDDPALRATLRGAEILVVVGGDGTVHSAVDAAIETGVSLYQLPEGTENLFARGFGMDRTEKTLIRAIRQGAVREIDAWRCNGRTFLIMAGVGPDASVIHCMASKRQGPISHFSYLGPMWRAARTPGLGPLRVEVDGATIVDGESGWLLLANMSQYALRMDPSPHADPTDGMLDVAFFPARNSWTVLRWTIACRARRDTARSGAVHARGKNVIIESVERDLPVQLDGDPAPFYATGASPLAISPVNGRVRVLMPG